MALNFLNNGYFAGEVGIGTTTPSSKLQIGSRGTASALTINAASGDGILFDFYNDGNPYLRHASIIANGDSSASQLEFWTSPSGAGVSKALTLDSSQNATFAGDIISSGSSKSIKTFRRWQMDGNADFGINNASGSSVLLISGGGTPSTSTATFAGSATIETGINLESGTLLIKNATSDSNGLRIYQDSSDTARIYNYYDGPLVLGQNNVAVMTIGADTNATFEGNVISKDTFYLENGSGNRWQMLFDTNAFNLRYYNGTSWSADAFAIDTSNNATFAGNLILPGEEHNGFKIAFTGASASSGLSTVDQSGAGLYIGANSFLNTSGNVTYNNSAYPSSGIYFDGWLGDDMEFYTGASGAPTKRLTIASDGTATFTGTVNVGTTATKIVLTPAGDAYMTTTRAWQLSAAVANTTYPTYGFYGDTGTGMYSAATDTLAFCTSAVERMRIFADGDVSIGMTANYAMLNVNGNIRAENSSFLAGRETAGAPAFAFHDDADTGMFNVASNILCFSTAGTERMRIDSAGNVGIGVTPIRKFDVNGTSTFYDNVYITSSKQIQWEGGNYWTWRVSGTEFQIYIVAPVINPST